MPSPALRPVEGAEHPASSLLPGRGGAGGLTGAETAGVSQDGERSGEPPAGQVGRGVAPPHEHLQPLLLHPVLRHELHPLVERLHALEERDVSDSDGHQANDWRPSGPARRAAGGRCRCGGRRSATASAALPPSHSPSSASAGW